MGHARALALRGFQYLGDLNVKAKNVCLRVQGGRPHAALSMSANDPFRSSSKSLSNEKRAFHLVLFFRHYGVHSIGWSQAGGTRSFP